jgi:nucleoside phosphorylase
VSVSGETLVCFALPGEARPFQRSMQGRSGVRVVLHGMGHRNAAAVVEPLVRNRPPARVLTCGFAGGLDPGLSHSTVLFQTAELALARSLQAAGIREARFHSALRMAITGVEKSALRRETGACAVEMESAVIHDLCRDAGVACATVRVISDVAGEDLPLDFNRLTTPDLRIDGGKLALAVAGAPWKIPALIRLQRRTAAAADALAVALTRAMAAAD